ncbi:MAG: arsenate reductase (glutaredoxin) [Wenzhouxiangellaceae bacterium]|nr:arsenate reductase (glutaredoxin) [Wenzhouxiangellaceae bacterium]
MQVTVYHNPRCSKSRATLELLEQRGVEATVIEYLKTPPDAQTIARLAAGLNAPPRELLRSGDAAWKALGLDVDEIDETRLFETLAANPALLQRPIVTAGRRTRIGRPPESVCEIL